MLRAVFHALVWSTLLGAAASAESGAPRVVFPHVKITNFTHPLGYRVFSATYSSNPIDLAPGEIFFTPVGGTKLRMPPAKETGYALLSFGGDVVYSSTHQHVPLSECYNHHWTAAHVAHNNAFCSRNIRLVSGIAPEFRNRHDAYPQGYGYIVKPENNVWGVNIHLIQTTGLAGDDAHLAQKECIECYYASGKVLIALRQLVDPWSVVE